MKESYNTLLTKAEILEKYNLSPSDLMWIGNTYNFIDGRIPEGFLDDLVVCIITTNHREKLAYQDTVTFFDYKYDPVAIKLNVTAFIPEANLSIIEKQSTKLSHKTIRQEQSTRYAETVDFRCDETVHTYRVTRQKKLVDLKRSPEAIAHIKATAAIAAAKAKAESEQLEPTV